MPPPSALHGWCASSPALNVHPFIFDRKIECRRQCLRTQDCRFTVWDTQRGYCYLFRDCDNTVDEDGVLLETTWVA